MRRLIAIILAIVSCAWSYGQSIPYGNGIIPYRSYDYSKVGVVDLKTRHLTLNIPLLSFKQKGSLPDLSVSFVYNSSRWESYRPDDSSGNDNYWWLPFIAFSTTSYTLGLPFSPVTSTLATGVGEMYAAFPVSVPLNGTYGSYEYVSSINGPTSLVGTNSDWSNGITLDGTGIGVVASATSTKVTDKNGVTYNLRYCSASSSPGYCSQVAGYIKDSYGNQVTLNYPSGETGSPLSFTDSIGRIFDYFSTANAAGTYTNYYPNGSSTSLVISQSAHTINSDLPNIGGSVHQYTDSWVLIDSITLPNGAHWGFHYNAYGDISQIDLPTGGTISYTWDSAPDPDDQTSYDRVVTSRIESDGANSYTWNYSQFLDSSVGGIIVTDPDNNDTAYLTRNPCARELEIDYFQGHWTPPSYGGNPCVPSAANLLKTEYTIYAGAASGAYAPGSGYAVQLPLKKVSTWPNGQTLETDYAYDNTLTWTDPNFQVTGETPFTQSYSTGSLKSLKEYDYGVSGAGALIRQTLTGYKWEEPNSPYLTANLLNFPSSVIVEDGAGTPITEKDYTYDGILGLDTTLNSGLPGEQVTTHRYLNSDGMVSGRKDGRGNSWSITYGCGGLVPYQLKNPLNQTTILSCDSNTENVTSIQDPNGAITGYTYTSVNDPLVITSPDNGTITYDYHGYATPLHITSTQIAMPDPNIVTDTYFDGLGRPTKVVRAGVETDTQYDGLGQVISVSNPSNGAPTEYTTYSYDALGRKLLQCNPGNRAGNGSCSPGANYRQWSYNGNLINFYDEMSNTWQSTLDGLGRLIIVVEPNQAHTVYGYNTLGNLTSVVQSGLSGEIARTRNFSYNSLSHLITAQNSEAGTICYGTWNGGSCINGYDGNGNLISKTDAGGVISTYHYDALNRIISKQFSGAGYTDHPTPARCYAYDANFDAGLNTIGRLTGEWSEVSDCSPGVQNIPSSAISWKKGISYDAMGRVRDEMQCPVAPCTVPNPMHYDYDLAGKIVHQGNGLANSQSPQVGWTNSYDAAGRLTKILSDWSDTSGHPATLFNAQDSNGVSTYGPFGLTAAEFGIPESSTTAALTEGMSYDNRGRILLKEFTGPAQAGTTSTISFNPNTISFTLADQPFVPIQVSCNSACGQVQFLIDGKSWSMPQTLDGNGRFRAYGLPTDLALGDHYIQAQYMGNAAFTPSLSNRIDFTLLPIGTTPSSIQVSLKPNTSTFTLNDQPVVPVQVSCNSACGWVQFLIDGNNWSGPQQLDTNGRFQGYGFPTNLTKNQQHYIQVKYLGNSMYAASSSTQISFTLVDPGSTPTTITATLDPPLVGFRVSDLASVKVPTQVGCDSACGRVSFTIDGVTWSDPAGYNLDSTGKYSAYGLPPLSLGQHEIRAYYLGNPTYAPIESSPVILTVLPDSELPTSTTVSLSPVKSTFTLVDQPIYPVQVSCNTNCGSVQFSIDDVNWTIPQTLNSNGQFNGHDIPLDTPPGLHFMRVQYLGSQTFAPSISVKLPFTLAQVGTTVTSISVSLSPVKSTYSHADLSSTTVPVQVGCNSACGKLQFYIDNNPWSGPQVLNSTGYFAGYGFPTLSLGVHHISVQYLGNATYAPISGEVDITVTN